MGWEEELFNQRRLIMQRPCGRREQSQFEELKGGHVAEPRTYSEVWCKVEPERGLEASWPCWSDLITSSVYLRERKFKQRPNRGGDGVCVSIGKQHS